MKKLIPQIWKDFLSEEISSDSFKKLESFLEQAYREKNILPQKENLFKAFSFFPPKNVRVVIIGQDPYHTPEYATGLSFSIPKEMKLPPSLKNIYKEIETDLDTKKDFLNGDLSSWAQEGVLLINSILSVEQGKPTSHYKKGWEEFTDAVIKKLSRENNHLVFILWGNFARSKKGLIDESKHLILESPHPSPLSAYRGFFGNKHFSHTNNYLKKYRGENINW